MTIGIVVFPGSNCDRDVQWALEGCLERPTRFLWHEERDLTGLDAVVLPGGFSYGDYLRCGAIARFAPVLEEVRQFAAGGGPVLGICNGFQVLTEMGLLPGALTRNRDLHFLCEPAPLEVQPGVCRWLQNYGAGERITLVCTSSSCAYVQPITSSTNCTRSTITLFASANRAASAYACTRPALPNRVPPK